MTGLRIAQVDDHPLCRDALAQVLRTDDQDTEISESGSLDELIGRIDAGAEVDLVLLDPGFSGLHDLIGLLYFRSADPSLPVMVVSAQCEPPVPGRCLMLGAARFIAKSGTIAEIRAAVGRVMAGERWLRQGLDAGVGSKSMRDTLVRLSLLTRREIQVCLLLSKGQLNQQIAHQLNISQAAVKTHMSDLLEKLNVSSRTQALALLQQLEGAATGRMSEPAPNAGAERWSQQPAACLPFLAQYRSATSQGAAP